MTPGAIAVFAKTPGLSAVKTRLAAQIGIDKARAIYESSLVATAAVLRAAADADGWRIFFALAEADGVGDRFWRAADFAGFRFMASGAGGLGERLDFVSRALLAESKSAILIGADSPQIAPSILRRRARATRARSFRPGRGRRLLFVRGGAPVAGADLARGRIRPRRHRRKTARAIEAGRAARPIRLLPPAVDIDDCDSLRAAVAELKKRLCPRSAKRRRESKKSSPGINPRPRLRAGAKTFVGGVVAFARVAVAPVRPKTRRSVRARRGALALRPALARSRRRDCGNETN